MRSYVARVLPVAALVAIVAGGIAPNAAVHAAPKGWKLPANAREVAPDVFEISSKQVGDRTKFCWAIIDRAHDAKPDGVGGPKGGGSSGFTYLSAGMKWKTVESYVVDPAVTHSDGTLDATYVSGVVRDAIGQWEDAANGTVGDGVSVNVMGDEVSGTVDAGSIGDVTNGVNEVCFAPIAESGVIAVTYVWGYYSGPTKFREIIEWDQIYDDDGNWTWGDCVTSGSTTDMDFAEIAQHEIGHAFGMGHSGSTYTEETMYAYAANGETKKRSLNTGDIAGIDGLY